MEKNDASPNSPHETTNIPLPWDMTKKIIKEMVNCTKKMDLSTIGKRSGDVVVITGGARGIGADVVQKLLQCDFHVVMGLRSPAAGEKFVNELRRSGIESGTSSYLKLDLKSLKSVRAFAQEVLDKFPKIHILICNAGIMFGPYELTEDGFENQFQVDYLSHFLLTDILLPRMIQTAAHNKYAGRIVNVSSAANWAGHIKNIDEIETRKTEYNQFQTYYDAKLCQVAASNYLDKKLRTKGTNVYAYSIHPGVIPTELGDSYNNPPTFMKKMMRSTEDGADVIVCASASPEFEKHGGIFLMNCKIETPNSDAINEKLQENLYKKSCKLLGLEKSNAD